MKTDEEIARFLKVPLGRVGELREVGRTGYRDGGFKVYDIRDKSAPKLLSYQRTGGVGVHRFDVDERYAYISTEMEGFQGNILVIYDLDQPDRIREVSRWWMPGQHIAGGEVPERIRQDDPGRRVEPLDIVDRYDDVLHASGSAQCGERSERDRSLVEARARDVPQSQRPLERSPAGRRHVVADQRQHGLQQGRERAVRDRRLHLGRSAREHAGTDVSGETDAFLPQRRLADSRLSLDLEEAGHRTGKPARERRALGLAADDERRLGRFRRRRRARGRCTHDPIVRRAAGRRDGEYPKECSTGRSEPPIL